MPPEPSAADQAKGGQKMDEQQDNEHREEQVGPDDYDEELAAADDKVTTVPIFAITLAVLKQRSK